MYMFFRTDTQAASRDQEELEVEDKASISLPDTEAAPGRPTMVSVSTEHVWLLASVRVYTMQRQLKKRRV